MKKNKTYMSRIFFAFIRFLIAAGALVYLFLRLKRMDFSSFVLPENYLVLLLVFLLLPLNLLLEIVKWRKLFEERPPWSASVIAVFKSLPVGFLTPGRIGEIPARAAFVTEYYRRSAVSASVYSSLLQQGVTIFSGAIALLFCGCIEQVFSYRLLMLLILFFLLAVLLAFFLIKQMKKKKTVIVKGVPEALLAAMLRYFVFSTQFVLLLNWLGAAGNFLMLYGLVAVYYLFLHLFPVSGIWDIGLRGSAAVVAAQIFSEKESVMLYSAALLWLINVVLPVVIGSFLLLSNKRGGRM